MQASRDKLRIAVLISGGGTTLRNLIEKIGSGALSAEIALVISSSPTARGLEFARAAGIPTLVCKRSDYADTGAYSEAMFSAVRQAGAPWVVMGGFLKHVLIPPDFQRRVVNIHPSLIPNFCGSGFYGHHVHEAVLAAGVAESGCTVHLVDDHYDHGPILAQARVPVLPGDTPQTLAARVAVAEFELYPQVLNQIATSGLADFPLQND